MIDFSALWNVLLLSFIASLGTGVGGLLALIRRPGRRSFGFLMGLTAGVMITLAFLELVNTAWELQGFWTATIGFGAGAFFMLLIDIGIPHIRFGERETHDVEPSGAAGDIPDCQGRRHRGWGRRRNHIVNPRLLKTGILLAIGITIHNLPEGVAVGAGYMHQPEFGLLIALAIMLHNIPEGIATALPLCQSGVCRRNAFLTALLSGMAEPVGALIAVLFLQSFQVLVPGALAFAGGVMLFITLDELLPAAREHGHQHSTAVGIILGSLLVFVLEGVIGA